MPFGEYELSLGLIGLSLLPSPHPKAFQRPLVRTSISCYRNFILDKGRSLSFASDAADSRSLQTRFRSGSDSFGSSPRRQPQLVGSLCKRHAVTAHAAPTACRRTLSGSISLPCSGSFSPFPHGTGPLSVSYSYLALPDGPGCFIQDSSCPELLRIPQGFSILRVRSCHALRPRFPARSARIVACPLRGPSTLAAPQRRKFGLLPVRSPLLRESFAYFLFLQVLRCFSSPRSPPTFRRMSFLQNDGLSHSDICGSMAACAYPQLFAACRVLLRL